MTENQLYTIAADFCDSSSNSSNLLKFELYGGGSLNNNPQYTTLNSLRESPMLTTASISIPQRNSSGHPPRIMADFSELGLDALDASSLSPNLLQDVSLNSMTGLNGQFTVSNLNSNNSGENVTLYEVQNPSTNSNTMWSDIGNAMTTMKTEPFHMEDDYIFQIDKSDLIQGPTLAELNDEALLEDLNIEDLIRVNDPSAYSLQHGHLNQLHLSPQHLNMLESSLPPQQLLQHHQGQQQHHQHHQQQNQQQQQQQQTQLALQLQNSSGNDVLYDEQNTTGSSSPYDIYQTTPTKSLNSSAAFSPGSQASSNSPLMTNSVTPPPHTSRTQFHQNLNQQHSGKTRSPALHELLKKDYSMSPDRNVLGQSVPGPSTSHMYMAANALSPASSGFGSGGRKTMTQQFSNSATSTSRLSSSAPTHLGLEQIWQRREPRQHLLSTGSLVEAESFSSISTGSVLSPEANDFSHDEGYSDYDSDHYEDFSSDNDSDNEDGGPRVGSHGKGKERYFWQYNVQAKGPKGQRLVIKTQLEDPHVLNEVTDPVFSPNCSVRGIKVYKHSGKARKGDGNDLTPNPKKLHVIGKELDKLGRTINDMTPVSELPFNVRPKSRKEKNKLASRACRLKKKAQHEANKIKLYGLEIEHKRLLNGINDVKRILAIKYKKPNENIEELNQQIEKITKHSTKVKIAGSSTEFVNKVLDRVKSGVPTGGLEELRNT